MKFGYVELVGRLTGPVKNAETKNGSAYATVGFAINTKGVKEPTFVNVQGWPKNGGSDLLHAYGASSVEGGKQQRTVIGGYLETQCYTSKKTGLASESAVFTLLSIARSTGRADGAEADAPLADAPRGDDETLG